VTRTRADADAEEIGRYQAKLGARADFQHPAEYPATADRIAAVLGRVRLRIAREKARNRTMETGTDKHAEHPAPPQTAQVSRGVMSTPENGQTTSGGLSGDS
jgi:hypothetical protein